MLKLLILDIDGVMTDGTKYYGLDGIPFAKTYCDKDFTAIKRMRSAGIQVCFLSGDDRVNKAMAENRNIDFYSARNKEKADFLPEFEKTYGATTEEMGYVGDDIFDALIMSKVGYAWTTADAPNSMKDQFRTLQSKGGENVIKELYDELRSKGIISEDPSLEAINELDKNEKF